MDALLDSECARAGLYQINNAVSKCWAA
jgi:hypothetical protein